MARPRLSWRCATYGFDAQAGVDQREAKASEQCAEYGRKSGWAPAR